MERKAATEKHLTNILQDSEQRCGPRIKEQGLI